MIGMLHCWIRVWTLDYVPTERVESEGAWELTDIT
jgi:hypothetical protein